MQILIFSDTHLTHHFNYRKYLFLKSIIEKADKVIINGDFWDGYLTDFNRFISSDWQKLFPLLKQKQTIYLYGNHDPQNKNDTRVKLFSNTQANLHTFSFNNQSIQVMHGHQFDKHTGNYKFIKTMIWIQKNIIQIFGLQFYQWLFTLRNLHIKNTIKKKRGIITITGHTHKNEYSPTKDHYLNSGMIRFGIGQYLLLENNKVRLVKTKY